MCLHVSSTLRIVYVSQYLSIGLVCISICVALCMCHKPEPWMFVSLCFSTGPHVALGPYLSTYLVWVEVSVSTRLQISLNRASCQYVCPSQSASVALRLWLWLWVILAGVSPSGCKSPCPYNSLSARRPDVDFRMHLYVGLG